MAVPSASRETSACCPHCGSSNREAIKPTRGKHRVVLTTTAGALSSRESCLKPIPSGNCCNFVI